MKKIFLGNSHMQAVVKQSEAEGHIVFISLLCPRSSAFSDLQITTRRVLVYFYFRLEISFSVAFFAVI